MRYCNMHTHTDFSDGLDSVEANIRSAIDKNMITLGISDHCYTYFDTSYCVQADRLAEYKSEVTRLKEKYKNDLFYVENVSFVQDVKIVFTTVGVVFKRKALNKSLIPVTNVPFSIMVVSVPNVPSSSNNLNPGYFSFG